MRKGDECIREVKEVQHGEVVGEHLREEKHQWEVRPSHMGERREERCQPEAKPAQQEAKRHEEAKQVERED